jgi:peptide-methionine (S)-S-oxide reductase
MWNIFGFSRPSMVTADEALTGRDIRPFAVGDSHLVLGGPLLGPWPDEVEVIYLAMGCFWGAERKYWKLPGVVGTAVGYMGGFTQNPTYEEVCSGRTGHTETVMVAYDPAVVDTYDILKVFWENHDPTQGFRQGNDVGTQYRSAIFWTTQAQGDLAASTCKAYDAVLTRLGFESVTTEIAPASEFTFYPAEGYHQQYLARNPNGYDCHAHTGIDLPPMADIT